ncbi:MAG TPA: GAF domain-containing protein [Verrucomicrobiae bacterium]|nr:GAF domain-containing protein [Verrucomicrobiae bacterium]
MEESPRQGLDEKLLERLRDKQTAELETRFSELQVLHELSKTILSSPDIQSTLFAALKNVLAASRLDIGNIRLFDSAGRVEHDAYLGYQDERNTRRHRMDAKESRGSILAPRVMALNRTVALSDIAKIEGLRTLKAEDVKSAILVPIATEKETLGIIEVGSRMPREFRPDEVRLLEAMGAQLGVAMQKARLFEEIRLGAEETHRRQVEQAAINAIAMATTQSLHVEELLKIALAKVLEVTGRERGSVKLKDPATGKVFLAAHQGMSEQYARTIRSHLAPEEKAAEIFNSGEVVVIHDPEKNIFNIADREAGLRSLVWVPLKARGEIIGILNVSTPQDEPFTAREIELLKNIGNVIGIAVENARLFEETERREREQTALYDELKQKVEELQRANKVKDEFLSVMSHELRTPLNVVIGYAGLIREGMLGMTNPEQNKALDKLVSRTNDLLAMITSMLYAASLEANEVELDNVQIALGDLLDDLKRKYAVPGKPIGVEWNYPADLPVVYSDRGKIKSILQNIIDNAIKFTEKGRVTVSARLAPSAKRNGSGNAKAAEDGDRIEFRISDTGIGISPEKIPVIFDKFRQADSSETRQFGGVGLGLYIARSFTDLLDGKISVESVLGSGSTFIVRLPCRRPADKAVVDGGAGAGFSRLD